MNQNFENNEFFRQLPEETYYPSDEYISYLRTAVLTELANDNN